MPDDSPVLAGAAIKRVGERIVHGGVEAIVAVATHEVVGAPAGEEPIRACATVEGVVTDDDRSQPPPDERAVRTL